MILDILRKKRVIDNGPREKLELTCPVKGAIVPLAQVADNTFKKEVLGKGLAIDPSEGKLRAPADGVVDMVADTLHAVGLNCHTAEVLLHAGIDTVMLKGRYFTPRVKEGDTVRRGDVLLEYDIAALRREGYDPVAIVVITNSAEFAEITPTEKADARLNEPFLTLKR